MQLNQRYAGSRELRIADSDGGYSFAAVVHYPTDTPSSPVPIGPFLMDVSPDAPVASGGFPLVLISHGTGGWHLLYRSISIHLARHGYLVASVEHHGNNRNDNHLAEATENLENRPRHLRLAADAICADPFFAGSVRTDRLAIVGHSLGGYTALAAAGGVPWTKKGERVKVQADPRIRALVLLAPATPFFMPPDSLKDVTVPILMYFGEKDDYIPRSWADIVINGVPDRNRVTCRWVENAGHFSFISPYPAHLKKPDFLPSTDPVGFDRETFHQSLPKEILEFLRKYL